MPRLYPLWYNPVFPYRIQSYANHQDFNYGLHRDGEFF